MYLSSVAIAQMKILNSILAIFYFSNFSMSSSAVQLSALYSTFWLVCLEFCSAVSVFGPTEELKGEKKNTKLSQAISGLASLQLMTTLEILRIQI